MSFNDNLHYLRKKNKITQEELADRLGVSRQSVSKWETGEAYPETEKLLLLCDMFGVTLDGLMRGDLTEVSESVVSCECRYEKHIKRFSTAMAVGVFLARLGTLGDGTITKLAIIGFVLMGIGGGGFLLEIILLIIISSIKNR